MTTEHRDQLANLLVDAAELEHSVVCQYLFLAFSMKRHPDEGGVTWAQLELMRRWEADLLLIARQEMEHLGIVSNMLTAIGEAPHFARPDFPIPSDYFPVDDPPSLEPFGLRPLRRLIRFERPAVPMPEHNQLLAAALPNIDEERPKKTVAELYRDGKNLLDSIDPKTLFIGPASAQRTTNQIIPVAVRGIPVGSRSTIYDIHIDPVTDLTRAKSAIDQIIHEGEGVENDRTTSHFGRLVRIADQLKLELKKDPAFTPARNVITNPRSDAIANPATRVMFDLFANAYETSVLLLLRYFGQSNESAPEVLALQQAAFFPMMTAVLRPLGEILTLLPVGADGSDLRAGPSFAFARRSAFLPHREAAWRLIIMRFEAMADVLKAARQSTDYSAPIRQRLSLIYENMERININFRRQMVPS